MIPGIDVSHWQNEIDWKEVKRSGVKFAFIKATEFPDKKTSLHIDEMVQNNISGASENNIHWSAYHFFRTHIDPVIQAKLFCEVVGDFSSLPPVLDMEVAGTKGERLNYKVKLFVEEVEKITGRKTIIYTSGVFWRNYLCSERRSHADWARNYPLWIAQYTNLWPTALYPWAGWDFWQYTNKGLIPGIETNVDMNWFNGSELDLVKRFIQTEDQIDNEEIKVELPASEKITTGVEKVYQGARMSETFRGDFQEPDRQHQHAVIGSAVAQKEMKNIVRMQNAGSHEEEWIRTYFLQ